MAAPTMSSSISPKSLHLAGIGVTHSIAPPMHNHIAQALGLPWTFYSTECPTIEETVALARSEDTQGLVVTMPYKASIMKHLDDLDPLATMLGACNNVYRDPSDPKILRGTNTDWRGIKGCLLEYPRPPASSPAPAMIVGAGGASRAAVYALSAELNCTTIYILNRDSSEVQDLVRDAQRLPSPPNLIHITSIDQAKSLETPHYIVGTVPDFEPQTETEIAARTCLEEFLSRPEKGVLLDMCFKPRRTRTIKLAEQYQWSAVEGTHIIMYQIDEQWRLWAGDEKVKTLNREAAWKVLLQAAEDSQAINF